MSVSYLFKKLFKITIVSFLVLCLVVLTCPYWLFRIVPAVGHFVGVEIASAERVEAGRWELREVEFESESIEVSATLVKLPSPFLYLRERFDGGLTEESTISFEGGQVSLRSSEVTQLEGDEGPDVVELFAMVHNRMLEYAPWVPAVELKDISVKGLPGALDPTIAEATLVDWKLHAEIVSSRFEESLSISGDLSPQTPWQIEAVLPDTDYSAVFRTSQLEEQLKLDWSLRQVDEVIQGYVEIGADSLIPLSGEIRTSGFTLEASWFPTGERWKVQTIDLTDLTIDWNDGRYAGQIQVEGVLPAEWGTHTIVQGQAAFTGDTEKVELAELKFLAPWADVRLSEPVMIRFSDGLLIESSTGAAQFGAAIDLSKQSFIKAQGKIGASFFFPVAEPMATDVRFELDAEALEYLNYRFESIRSSGLITRESIVFDHVDAQMSEWSEDDFLAGSGSVNWTKRHLDFELESILSSGFLNTILETDVFSNQSRVTGAIKGDWLKPAIDLSVDRVTMQIPGVEPLTVSGDLSVKDFQKIFWSGYVAAGDAAIEAELRGEISDTAYTVDLEKMILADPVLPELKLVAPIKVTLSRDALALEERLEVTPFEFTSEDIALSGSLDTVSGLALDIRNFSLDRAGRWVTQELPDTQIDRLSVKLRAIRPFLDGEIEVQTGILLADQTPVWLRAMASFDEHGSNVKEFKALFADQSILEGALKIPVRFCTPLKGEGVWQVIASGDFGGRLEGALTPELISWLEKIWSLELGAASVDVAVSGDLNAPNAVLSINAEDINLSQVVDEYEIPNIEAAEIMVRIDEGFLLLDRLFLSINNGTLQGQASLPVEKAIAWGQQSERQVMDLFANVSGDFSMRGFAVEKWINYLPSVFRRTGSLTCDLRLEPNFQLSGELDFQDFALRPTESFASVDQITGKIRLSSERLAVEEMSASVGGSDVSGTGWIEANGFQDPLWSIELTGENVPLVRTTDMIIRSDLAIKAERIEPHSAPLVSGRLDLKPSTLLVEFDPLSPTTEAGPGSRPPFFAIKEPLFENWRFDVSIFGDSFMRVRSPYFRTKLSADFNLGGTFAVPELIGSARTVDGELRFPGAKMRIDYGEAYIEVGSPDTLRLNFSGLAQTAPYTITMDVSHTMSDPHIQFQSTPDLSNAAIVRLLATGTTSGSGAGSVGLYLGKGLLGSGGMDESIMDRVTVDIGAEKSEKGRDTLGVKYQLMEDLYLKGEYDKYDAYNLNLIWSIFRR